MTPPATAGAVLADDLWSDHDPATLAGLVATLVDRAADIHSPAARRGRMLAADAVLYRVFSDSMWNYADAQLLQTAIAERRLHPSALDPHPGVLDIILSTGLEWNWSPEQIVVVHCLRELAARKEIPTLAGLAAEVDALRTRTELPEDLPPGPADLLAGWLRQVLARNAHDPRWATAADPAVAARDLLASKRDEAIAAAIIAALDKS